MLEYSIDLSYMKLKFQKEWRGMHKNIFLKSDRVQIGSRLQSRRIYNHLLQEAPNHN